MDLKAWEVLSEDSGKSVTAASIPSVVVDRSITHQEKTAEGEKFKDNE